MYMHLVRRGGKDLWDKLKDLILLKPGEKWCELSDFKSIGTSLERKGTGDFKRMEEMLAFNSFISDLELIDMPLIGWRFTWSSGSEVKREYTL